MAMESVSSIAYVPPKAVTRCSRSAIGPRSGARVRGGIEVLHGVARSVLVARNTVGGIREMMIHPTPLPIAVRVFPEPLDAKPHIPQRRAWEAAGFDAGL